MTVVETPRGIAPSVARVLSVSRGLAVASAAALGLWTIDRESVKWAAVTMVLYGTPLALQFFGKRARYLGAWMAGFLASQTLASLVLGGDPDYLTLEPNVRAEVDVRGGLPGISGRQTISTDAHGFRITLPIDYRHKGGPRVFAIGGSTTEQIYLDDRKTWTHLLQEGLAGNWKARVEVINTGASGLRAIHHLATIRRVMRFHPDAVVILMGVNDWNHQIVEEVGSRQGDADAYAAIRPRFFRNSILGKTLKLVLPSSHSKSLTSHVDYGEYYTPQRNSLRRGRSVAFHPSAVSAEYARTLQQIGDVCHQYGVPCVFVTQPTAYQASTSADVRANFWMTPPNQDYTIDFDSMVALAALYNDHLRAFAASDGHVVCDAAAQMPPTFENFYDDCHVNLGGARRLAGILETCLTTSIPQP